MPFTRTARRSLFALLLVSASPAALAQDYSDDTDRIVVSAFRVLVPESEVTSSLTVLEAERIEASGSAFAADALRAVPGLTVSRSGPAGSLTQVRARGSEANHVLVLIDGIEASNPFTGEYDFAHTPSFGVERIEVLHGEQSALWGPDAIGGVISIRTVGMDGEEGASLFAEGGSFDTWRTGAAVSGEVGYLSGGVTASAFSSGGFDVSGTGGQADGYDARLLGGAGTLDLGPDLRLEGALRLASHESEYDSDTDFDGRLDDADLSIEGRESAARLALLADTKLAGLDFAHEAALSWFDTRSENFDTGAFTGTTQGTRWQGYYEATALWTGFGADHRLTVLAERESERYVNFAGAGAGQNQTQRIENDALAADYDLTAGPVRIHLSARRDMNDRFEDATTWRAGLSRGFESIGGRMRASIGEGVKNPGVFELFGFFPGFFSGNPNLVPERSRGWEIGWDQELADASLSVTWFEARLEDEIFTDFGVNPATARNRTGESRRSGLEISGEWQAARDLKVTGSAAFLKSEENGVAEIRRPEQTASLAIFWEPRNSPLSLAVSADHVGDRTDTDFGTFQTVTLNAYTLVGGRASWRIGDHAALYLRGENLLDEKYEDVFGYASAGRGLYLGLRLQR
ncbi:TonB-dependent receptor [Hyphobacterium marinum]|uniref:TonB-dependent receptor n=1 Tax=Hyphobacterium marinum TaxID=3116574 RepID=A0ABU7LZ02_9PROT|nr:TonB-dependent receptor [Hyphobacterium sp. Y6023]MEE2566507.1 TonB-dependent receptor [Hyphobacterium sp. Y6023]